MSWTNLFDKLAWDPSSRVRCNGTTTARQMTMQSRHNTYHNTSSALADVDWKSTEGESVPWVPTKTTPSVSVHGLKAFLFHNPPVPLSVYHYYNYGSRFSIHDFERVLARFRGRSERILIGHTRCNTLNNYKRTLMVHGHCTKCWFQDFAKVWGAHRGSNHIVKEPVHSRAELWTLLSVDGVRPTWLWARNF